MPIITPEQLQADAILPQCLDNQFVSEEVLSEMVSDGSNFSSDEVKAKRYKDTHVEFLRSLLYSSQVVVNRAYFKNSDYLRAATVKEAEALAGLIGSQAIVPFVFKREEIDQPLPFSTVESFPEEAESAMELADLLGPDGTYLQLAEAVDQNKERVFELGANFAGFFTSTLKSINKHREYVEPVAQQLAGDLSIRESSEASEIDAEVLKRFQHLLADSANYVFNLNDELAENEQVGREHIYKRYFSAPSTRPAEGRFREEMRDPARVMFKKLVDLKYNANLPDMLSRYTLTPASMPGRSALPFERKGGTADTGKMVKTLEEFKQAVMDTPPEIVLPGIRTLRLEDVREVRGLPEWQEFSRSQQSLLLARPDDMVKAFERYQKGLLGFQSELKKWAEAKEKADAGVPFTWKEYKSVIQFVVSVGTTAFTITHNGLTLESVLVGVGSVVSGVEALEKLLPEIIPDWGIKLNVTRRDADSGKIDPDYTHQLEIMRHSGNMQRKELIQLMQHIQQSKELQQMQIKGVSEQAKC